MDTDLLNALPDAFRAMSACPQRVTTEIKLRVMQVNELVRRFPPPAEPGDYLLVQSRSVPHWATIVDNLNIGRNAACDIVVRRNTARLG